MTVREHKAFFFAEAIHTPKVKCALKPQSDERARDIFARTVASNAAQKLRCRRRIYTCFVLLRKYSFYPIRLRRNQLTLL